MSDLYDAFAAAASHGEDVDPSRRELLVEVIGHTAARRRTRRLALNAAASVAAVGLVGGWITAAAGMWGPGSTFAGPADATSHQSVSAPASPVASPSPSSGAADSVWDLAGPGWFLVAYDSSEAVSLTLVGPDGSIYDAGTLVGAGNATVAAWVGGNTLALTRAAELEAEGRSLVELLTWQEGDGGSQSVAVEETTIVAAVGSGTTIHVSDVATGSAVTSMEDLDSATSADLCVTGDAYGDALVTPDGTGVVCFDPVTATQTELVLAPTTARSTGGVLATFSFPAGDYVRLGWVSDTTLLFGRELEKGYRYFTFDIATGELADVFLPGDLDGWVPSFDVESRTYRLATPGQVEFFTEEGESLETIECDATSGVPHVWVSGTTALVACPGVDATQWNLSTVDLVTGASSMVLSLASAGGEDPLGGAFAYPTLAD